MTEQRWRASEQTLAVFLNGREIARTAGARPAQDIEAFVDQAVHAPQR